MMANEQGKHAHQRGESFEPERAEREFEEVRARLGAEAPPGASDQRLRQVEMLLRSAPFEAPSPGFAERVMAAVAAMTFPHMHDRRLSLSLAIGLALAALLTLPLLALGMVSLFGAISDPAFLNSVSTLAASAIGSALGLVNEYAASAETVVNETPMIPALLTTAIPLAMVTSWLVWYLLGGPYTLQRRVGL